MSKVNQCPQVSTGSEPLHRATHYQQCVLYADKDVVGLCVKIVCICLPFTSDSQYVFSCWEGRGWRQRLCVTHRPVNCLIAEIIIHTLTGGKTRVGSRWWEGRVLMYVETCEGGAIALVTTLFSVLVMYSQIKHIYIHYYTLPGDQGRLCVAKHTCIIVTILLTREKLLLEP